jgi:pimeloyl-ACP methyl ester carboxylesterase
MRVGHEPSSGTYYEVLGPANAETPVLLIHGGGATGACFRSDLHGNPGWADLLAERGHEVWVTDWPGCGRSGNRHLVDLEYADIVAGYRRLLRDVIARPAVVVCHSMGGATTWQLVEHEGDLVRGVVSVAAAYPGNIPPRGKVLREEGDIVHARFLETGVDFRVDRGRGYLYEDDYIYNQGIATSSRFPLDRVDAMRAGLVGFPPRMLLQRMGILPGLPIVEHPSRFAGKPIRLVAGTEDPAHRLETEQATVNLLRSWGADAELVWLGDRGIVGNGHFLFFEDNAAEILDIVAEQMEAVSAVAGRYETRPA